MPDDELDDYVDSLAAHIASHSGTALAAVEKGVNRRNLPADADFRTDTEDFTRLYTSAEVRATIAASVGGDDSDDGELTAHAAFGNTCDVDAADDGHASQLARCGCPP